MWVDLNSERKEDKRNIEWDNSKCMVVEDRDMQMVVVGV